MIKKVELEELKRNELQGTFWTMKDLEQRTGKKQLWLKENVHYPAQFRKTLNADQGGLFSTQNGRSALELPGNKDGTVLRFKLPQDIQIDIRVM